MKGSEETLGLLFCRNQLKGEKRMNATQARIVKMKLYLVQILYWMAFCAISGFATVFLVSRNIPSGEIGVIIALGSILSVFMQFSTSNLLEAFPKLTVRKMMYLFFGMGSIFGILVILFSQQTLLLAILYCLLFIILYNTQPLVTTLIYAYANAGLEITFSSTRGVGSLMYAITSFLLGLWLEKFTTLSLPVLFTFGLGFLALLIFSLPEVETDEAAEALNDNATPLKEFPKKYPAFFLFIIGLVFVFSFHTITNVYLPQMVESVGGGSKEIGFAIALAGICELPAMLGFKKLEEKFNVVVLLRISVLFYFFKGIIYVWASTFIGLQMSQLLQMFSFALLTPAYAHYVNEWMSPNDRVKGQTFVMAGVTLGNVIGSLAGGIILDVTTVKTMLVIGLGLTFLGLVVTWFSLRGKEEVLVKPN